MQAPALRCVPPGLWQSLAWQSARQWSPPRLSAPPFGVGPLPSCVFKVSRGSGSPCGPAPGGGFGLVDGWAAGRQPLAWDAPPTLCPCQAPPAGASPFPRMLVVHCPTWIGWEPLSRLALLRWASPSWTNGRGSGHTASNGPCWWSKRTPSSAIPWQSQKTVGAHDWRGRAIPSIPLPARMSFGWANGGVGANPATPPASRWSSRRRARLSHKWLPSIDVVLVHH